MVKIYDTKEKFLKMVLFLETTGAKFVADEENLFINIRKW